MATLEPELEILVLGLADSDPETAGENPSALLECLHLEALGVRVSPPDSLITLGGGRHLDGLEQRRRIGMSW